MRKAPDWGPWYRRIEPGPVHGEVLMRTPDGQPLLALDRVGQGPHGAAAVRPDLAVVARP